MGIRGALGARELDILPLVLIQALAVSAAGAAIGIGGSLALTRVLNTLLFGVTATDPTPFAGIAVLLVFIALAASCIPARRASLIDPAAALRAE